MHVSLNRLCWFVFLGATSLSMALSLGCADFGSSKKAVALLRVNREGFTGNAADFSIFKETQEQLLQSRFVIDSAMRSNKLRQIAGLSADKIAGSMKVVPSGESEIMQLSLRLGSWNADEAKAILNGVIEAYENEVADKQRPQQVEALTTMRERYAEILDSLAEKSDAVAKLTGKLGSQDDEAMNFQMDVEKEKLLLLQQQLIDLKLNEIDKELPTENADVEDNDETVHVRAHAKKIKAIEEMIERQTNEVQEFLGHRGELDDTKEELKSLQDDLEAVRTAMDQLELEIEGPNRVSVLQAAAIQ